jgi:thioredoxin 1
MKRMLPVCLCFTLALGVRADVIEFQNGAKSEGRVLALFNQRFEFAGKDGSITHVNLQQVKRISFDSETAAIVTREHATVTGQLVGLEDGAFTVAGPKGVQQHVAAVEVTDLMVSTQNTDAPSQSSPPSSRPKPAPASPASSRPPAKGSIQPEHGKITIVDFYADWCGPCRKISPVLEKIADGNSDIALQKINIDKHRDLAREYNVTAIPRIIIYDKNGGEVDTVVGADESRVRQAIENAGGSSR